MKKIFKCKNLFLVTFLAVAGIFSAISFSGVFSDTNIKKAEATTYQKHEIDWNHWDASVRSNATYDKDGSGNMAIDETYTETQVRITNVPFKVDERFWGHCWYKDGTEQWCKFGTNNASGSTWNNLAYDNYDDPTCKTAGVYNLFYKPEDNGGAGWMYIGWGSIKINWYCYSTEEGTPLLDSGNENWTPSSASSTYTPPSIPTFSHYTTPSSWKVSGGSDYVATRPTTTEYNIYAYYDPIMYGITEIYKINGQNTGNVRATYSMKEGSTWNHYEPSGSGIPGAGYTYNGWVDSNGSAITSFTVSGATTIYAKYTSRDFTNGKRYYLCIDSAATEWEKYSAWFAVYLYEPITDTATWIELTKLGNSHHYYFDMPSTGQCNKIKFVRLDPTIDKSKLPAYKNTESKVWNQTPDIFLDGTDSAKDFWATTGTSGDLSGSWIYANDPNSNYRLFDNPLTPTPDSMRYWFTFVNGGSGTDWAASSARLAILAELDGEVEKFYLLNTLYNGSGSTGTLYQYVDIPTSTTRFKIIRITNGSQTAGRMAVWNFQNAYITVNSTNAPSKLWKATISFVDNVITKDCVVSLAANSSLGTKYTISGHTAAKVLEAYYTCSSSTVNGYGAYANLKANYMDYVDATYQTLDTATLYDYLPSDYFDNNKSYTNINRSDVYQITARLKWNSLSAASQGKLAINNFKPYDLIVSEESSSSVIIIIISSSVALLSITALSVLMVKKRKSKQQ